MKKNTYIERMKNIQHLALCLLVCVLLLNGCAAKPETETIQEPTKQEIVRELQCIQPTAFSTIHAVSGGRIAVCTADYDNESTTLQLVDAENDKSCGEIVMEGIWDFKDQTFFDGRIALCDRENHTWKFLNRELEEIDAWHTEVMDGFFSFDGSTYYCLIDHALFRLDIDGGSADRMTLTPDLRIQELSAFRPESGILLMQCQLSPYSNECGTAAFNIQTGTWVMLQSRRYHASFCGCRHFL